MNLTSVIRFRLWHLFVVIAVACVGMWIVTQAGMETAEIEIIQYDAVPVLDIPGVVFAEMPYPDGGVASLTEDMKELSKVKFTFLKPEDVQHETISVFMAPTLTVSNFEVGQRLKFRYRAKSVLWFDAVNPTSMAIDLLQIEQDSIEEIITESGDSQIER